MDEISFGKARIILLPVLLGLVIIFFLKIFSIKISFWICAVLFIAVLIIVIMWMVFLQTPIQATSMTTEIKQKKPITVKSATTTLSWIALGLIVSVIIFYAILIIIFLFGVIIGVMDGFGMAEFLKAVSKVFG
ncbi:MAG: hypothetical protein KAU07_00715 [Candidatus Andersenbacteria bacterium]|nr:hypothetical protein [Candidatus Andersenbacteria bacterium]